MESRTIIVTLVLALAAGPVGSDPGIHAIDWSEDMGASSRRAADEVRPLLVDVWAVWCAPCKEMEETTYLDERVVTLARERFVALKVDADLKDSFIERHAIDAYPTLLFLDGKGRELARREGLVRAEELASLAERVAGGYAAYVDAMSGPGSGTAARFVREYLMSLSSVEIATERIRSMSRSARRKAPGEVPAIRLEFGWALLAAESLREATRVFTALADSDSSPEVRGPALTGLLRAEQARGRIDQAAAVLERLRQEFPELAGPLDPASQRFRE